MVEPWSTDLLQTTLDSYMEQVVLQRSELHVLPRGLCWEEVTQNPVEVHPDAYFMETTWRVVRLEDPHTPGCRRFIPRRPEHS